MIKALLVVTLMSGAEYAVNMPDMNTCMENANLVVGQGRGAEAICIPRSDTSAKVKDMFTMFGDMVERLQENELGTSSRKCGSSSESL